MKKKSVKKPKKSSKKHPVHHIKHHAKKFVSLPNRLWNWADTPIKKIILITAIILITLIAVYVITNIYVFINFLLGNDTLVKLTANHEDFYLKNGDSEVVEFGMFVSTNLFCEATCGYSFEDLSSGELIDSDSFNTKLANPNKKEYTITAPESGVGQKLYRFEMRCKSKKNGLCKTEEEEKKRSFLIALNYELNENQSILREEAYSKLSKVIDDDSTVNLLKLQNNYLHKELGRVIFLDGLNNSAPSSIEGMIDANLNDWANYEYSSVIDASPEDQISVVKAGLMFIQNSLNEKAIKYNSLIDFLEILQAKTILLSKKTNLTELDLLKIDKKIKEYNALSDSFSKKFNLNNKIEDSNNFQDSIDSLDLMQNETTLILFNLTTIKNNIPSKIDMNKSFDYESNFTIEKERPICCYDGNCQKCCDSACANDKTKYPVILLHGHSFNSAISAEKSLGDLGKIQERLVNDGFLDGGYLILRDGKSSGTFSKANEQIVFAASYYFDIYKNQEETTTLQTQSDDINTYALRLNDIVKSVKDRTGRDKVYLVAHSMGGLVSRRYLQIYGDNDVEKLIMIGTPNNGIDGTVLSGCPVFGANSHCDDMDKNSLLINKLTYGEIPGINATTIIGQGCSMDGVDGDGIVKVKSAELDWTKNIYINGTCDGFSFLHNTMLNPQKYPEVYNIVKAEILE